MASGFSTNSQFRNRNSVSSGLPSRGFNNHPPRPRYPPLTDRSGVPLSRTRRRIVCGPMPPVSQTCRFFRAGLCQYGDRCRFYHIEVPHTATSTDVDASNAGSSTDNQPVLKDSHCQQSNSHQQNSQDQLLHQQKPQQTSQQQIMEPQNSQFDDKSQIVQLQSSQQDNSVSTILSTSQEQNCTTSESSVNATIPNPVYDKWLDAPEFVPSVNRARMKSYAEAVNPSTAAEDDDKSEMKLCPYAEMHGVCSYADGECTYLHGNICDLCGTASLHPFNQEKRKLHIQSCIEQHERNMELSFAVQRSKEKSCGVCFEIIMEKSTREQRFGILPNCNHCFCLTCIRKWRQAKQFDNKIIRACPECRVTSDFVCPSMYWVDTKEEKEKLIKDYKCALSQKNCKYFKQGRGKCPFGNKCFYLHALPDGTKTDVGPPPRQPRRQAHDGDIDVLQQIILWDYLDDRQNRWLYSIADDLEDLVAFFSDSEDSDWSEYEFFFD